MKEICEHILLYLDKELDSELKTEFEAHLSTCDECKKVIMTFGDDYLQLSNPETVFSEDEKRMLYTEIEEELNSRKWEKWLVAASVVLLVMNLMYYYLFMLSKSSGNSENLLQYTRQTVENVYEDPMSDFLLTYVINGEDDE